MKRWEEIMSRKTDEIVHRSRRQFAKISGKTLALKRLLGIERHCSEMLWWFTYKPTLDRKCHYYQNLSGEKKQFGKIGLSVLPFASFLKFLFENHVCCWKRLQRKTFGHTKDIWVGTSFIFFFRFLKWGWISSSPISKERHLGRDGILHLDSAKMALDLLIPFPPFHRRFYIKLGSQCYFHIATQYWIFEFLVILILQPKYWWLPNYTFNSDENINRFFKWNSHRF